MKKIVFTLFSLSLGLLTTAQKVDEVLSKHELANGGIEKIAAINTLQYTSIMKLNMMQMQIDVNSINIIENKKLYRKAVAGMMGMKGSYTMVTDTAGYISTPAVRAFGDFPGMEGGVTKMDESTLKKGQEKLDILSEFSILINCKAKGFNVELTGTSKVEKVECFKLKLTSPEGEISTCFIDANTYLLKQMEVSGKQVSAILGLRGGPMGDMMGGRMDKQKMLIIYKEYSDVAGVKFPSKMVIQLGASDVEIENTSIEINEPIEKKWYIAN